MNRTRLSTGAILALASLPVSAMGQQGSPAPQEAPALEAARQEAPPAPVFASLVGQVVSAMTGRPLEGAVVNLVRSGYGAITDSTGNFRIPTALAGLDTAEIRYIGYEPSKTPLELQPNVTNRVTLLLSPTVVRVAELTVEVEGRVRVTKLSGFEERRAKGFGIFFTPNDIRSRNPRLPSDLMRGMQGVRVGRIEHGVAPVYMGRGIRADCPPAVYLDGVYQSGLQPDDIPPDYLGAVEIYRGPSETPGEFMRTSGRTCGAVVIWTPDGPNFWNYRDPQKIEREKRKRERERDGLERR